MNAGEGFFYFVLPGCIMAGTSVVYFRTDPHSSLTRRLLTSAHGAVAALLYVAAVVIAALAQKPLPDVALVLAALYVVPAVLLVVSAIWYRGRKDVHFLQLLAVPSILFTAFVGLFMVGVQAI